MGFIALRPLGVRDRIHHVTHEALERFIFNELLVELRIVLHRSLHRLAQRLVERHTRGVRGVLLRILVGHVSGDLRRDVLADTFGHTISVGEQGGELLVE